MNEYSESGKRADILLVEDNPGDIRLTEEAFKESRISNTLHVVRDGNKALDFLRQRGDYTDAPRPDIIFLDLNLPGRNGDEILEEINTDHDNADPELSRIPVIILTSSKAEEDIVKSYDLQANAYLTKPIDPADFIEVIKRFKAFWLEIVKLPPSDIKND